MTILTKDSTKGCTQVDNKFDFGNNVSKIKQEQKHLKEMLEDKESSESIQEQNLKVQRLLAEFRQSFDIEKKDLQKQRKELKSTNSQVSRGQVYKKVKSIVQQQKCLLQLFTIQREIVDAIEEQSKVNCKSKECSLLVSSNNHRKIAKKNQEVCVGNDRTQSHGFVSFSNQKVILDSSMKHGYDPDVASEKYGKTVDVTKHVNKNDDGRRKPERSVQDVLMHDDTNTHTIDYGNQKNTKINRIKASLDHNYSISSVSDVQIKTQQKLAGYTKQRKLKNSMLGGTYEKKDTFEHQHDDRRNNDPDGINANPTLPERQLFAKHKVSEIPMDLTMTHQMLAKSKSEEKSLSQKSPLRCTKIESKFDFVNNVSKIKQEQKYLKEMLANKEALESIQRRNSKTQRLLIEFRQTFDIEKKALQEQCKEMKSANSQASRAHIYKKVKSMVQQQKCLLKLFTVQKEIKDAIDERENMECTKSQTNSLPLCTKEVVTPGFKVNESNFQKDKEGSIRKEVQESVEATIVKLPNPMVQLPLTNKNSNERSLQNVKIVDTVAKEIAEKVNVMSVVDCKKVNEKKVSGVTKQNANLSLLPQRECGQINSQSNQNLALGSQGLGLGSQGLELGSQGLALAFSQASIINNGRLPIDVEKKISLRTDYQLMFSQCWEIASRILANDQKDFQMYEVLPEMIQKCSDFDTVVDMAKVLWDTDF